MDDPDIIAKHLPELGKLPILKGYDDDRKEILEEPKNKITLKMLLTHSSGMSTRLGSLLVLILRTGLRVQ
jgi:CubicO group peptidase (beta-lactamase class C family)